MRTQIYSKPISTLYKAGIASVLCAAMLLTNSCTKEFDNLNTDPNSLTDELYAIDNNNIGSLIPQMEESIYHNYGNPTWVFQIQQNLNSDIFSGYLMPPTPFAGGQNNSNYSLVAGWNSWAFSTAYLNVMTPWYKIKLKTKDLNTSLEFYGVATILKVLGMHRVVDTYGPIPYVKFGSVTPAYDSQEEIYKTFFAELDEAVTLLKTKPASNLNAFDVMYAGNLDQWLKLANTLRLRLALRIVKANPSMAKVEAEKALAASEGLLTIKTDIAQVNDPKINHPLATIANAWGDIRMGASIETYVVGYNDPRLPKFFSLASDPALIPFIKGYVWVMCPPQRQIILAFHR